MLFAVLHGLCRLSILLFLISCFVGWHATVAQQSGQNPPAPAPTQSQAQAPANEPPISPPQNPGVPPATPQAPAHVGPTIVIDPGHGGTDNGAQGPSGTVEKDLVLRFARQIRAEFERQGYRVVMTRNDDSNPSYEDRAAVANAYRDAIFISVHVSSSGKIGTAHAYSYQYSSAVPADAGAAPASGAAKSLLVWDQAQRPYLDGSHRLADLLQMEVSLRFAGSESNSRQFAVRELRSVAAPAVAVELSSVAVPDANMLVSMGAPLAYAVVRSVQLLRPTPAVSRNDSASNSPTAGAN